MAFIMWFVIPVIVFIKTRVCGLKEAGTAAGGDATDQELEDRYKRRQDKLRSMQRPFELRCGWHRVARGHASCDRVEHDVGSFMFCTFRGGKGSTHTGGLCAAYLVVDHVSLTKLH